MESSVLMPGRGPNVSGAPCMLWPLNYTCFAGVRSCKSCRFQVPIFPGCKYVNKSGPFCKSDVSSALCGGVGVQKQLIQCRHSMLRRSVCCAGVTVLQGITTVYLQPCDSVLPIDLGELVPPAPLILEAALGCHFGCCASTFFCG